MDSAGSGLDLEALDEHALRGIIRGTLAVTGDALFRATATQLARLFGARCVIVGALRPERPDQVCSLATYVEGGFGPDGVYPLAGTLWSELLDGRVVHVEHDAQQRYPTDAWLAALGADRVLGIRLVAAEQVVGLIAVIDAAALPSSTTARGVLAIFARVVAAEIARLRHERLERDRANAALSHRSALLQLAHLDRSDLQQALRTIVATDAVTLGVARVSYWALAEDRSQIVCEELYQLATGTFDRGAVLRCQDYPAYFCALLASAPLVAHDARSDPRTVEFTSGYFVPCGITSMLDVPVWRDGRLAGVLCHEHVGPARTWRDEESDFAISAATACSLALEEAERHRAEERYELIARATNDVLWDWNLETDGLTFNAGLHSVLRYAAGQVPPTIGWWAEHIHVDDRAPVLASVQTAIDGVATAWEMEYRFIRGDDSVARVFDRGFIVRGANGKATRMVGAMVDITERKAIEARLLVADRMASIGTLAAGVAHEINNPLAYIIANVDFALEQLVPGAGSNEIAEALAEAREGAVRVRTIVRDLRAFSRSDDEARGPVELRRVIESSINMAWNEIRHRARLVKDFGPTAAVLANEARLGQVVLNVLVNAAQAIPEGAAEDNEIRIVTGIDERGRAFIEVRDTGPGIPKEHRSRVFDPFFTTKQIGLGTGLGLSICHTIVSSLGGEIAIGDAPGRGCIVRVSLPSVQPDVAAVAAEVAAPAIVPAAKATVLVVDDDARVG
ncbi:MAG: GAF domain-containing protein, partial [Deltaproteobacteria bacterium]|nr:GAF domain-containing protein [Deltaproteobacteria bacterium]